MPIAKGGTGATDVVSALKSLKLLNYNFTSIPACSALMYKNYTDFGLSSMTMHSFFNTIPEYSFFVFENNKNALTYISDAPYTLGLIYAFKGFRNNCHSLFFTGQGGGDVVYHYLCNSQVVLKNWTKINDNGNADTIDGKHASEFATATQMTNVNTTLNNKVDKVSGKGLSTNDFTATYKSKLDGIQASAKANVQSDWNVTASNSDAFIKNKPTSLPANEGNADTVDGKHASDFATAAQMTTANNTLNNKVDKVSGKGLSTNDFTAAYKTKLDGIANGAEANIQSDWNITDTNSDAFIKNKPQNLVNKTELPTMCPQGFYKEYLSVSLESNSYYKIALDWYCRGNGLFVLDVVSDKRVIYESHVVFSASSSVDTFLLDNITNTNKLNVLTHGFNRPTINKILICNNNNQTNYLAIRTADFKEASPIDTRIYINFIGREYKTYDTIEKVEIPQKLIIFETTLN